MVLALFASYLESKDSMQMSKEKHIPIIAYVHRIKLHRLTHNKTE